MVCGHPSQCGFVSLCKSVSCLRGHTKQAYTRRGVGFVGFVSPGHFHLPIPYRIPINPNSVHFIFHYPYIIPNITPIYAQLYYSSFHFLFHYPQYNPYITPIKTQNNQPTKPWQRPTLESHSGRPSAYSYLGVSQNSGTVLGVPILRIFTIFGSILGSPYFGKLPFHCKSARACNGILLRRQLCTTLHCGIRGFREVFSIASSPPCIAELISPRSMMHDPSQSITTCNLAIVQPLAILA